MANIWNDRVVEYATQENKEGILYCLLGICLFIYAASITAIGVMFYTFSCPENLSIISLTVILCFLATCYQVYMTKNGSLLTSAIMTGYATYLCYSSVSLDPDPDCNPTIGNASQNWSQILGMFITTVSVSSLLSSKLTSYDESILS